jgi:CRISPR-associated protein Cas6
MHSITVTSELERPIGHGDVVELCFPVTGEQIPLDHAYSLFAALTHKIPYLHNATTSYHMGTIPCLRDSTQNRIGKIRPNTMLRFRISVLDLPHLLLLSGQDIDIEGHTLHIGSPIPYRLKIYPNLYSRIVVIKGYTEPEAFLEAVYRRMQLMGIVGQANIHADKGGRPQRRTVRIRDKQIVGFPVTLTGLSSEASLKIQALGIGGRGKFGCGFFQPLVLGRQEHYAS